MKNKIGEKTLMIKVRTSLTDEQIEKCYAILTICRKRDAVMLGQPQSNDIRVKKESE